MPLMVTFFNVRKGRDAIFKRGMRHFFPTGRIPKEMRRYEREYGIRFVGWFNVTEGSTGTTSSSWTCRTTRSSTSCTPTRRRAASGHRVAESIFDSKHTIFLRERMGPDFVYKP